MTYNNKTDYLHSMDEIVALQPAVIYGRSCCRVIYREGSYDNIPNKPNCILNRLSKTWLHTDAESLRDEYRKITGDVNARKVPVMLSSDCIFVPLRMRVIYENENDETEQVSYDQGYISLLDYHSQLTGLNDESIIILKNTPLRIGCSQGVASVKRQIERAEALRFTENYKKMKLYDDERKKHYELLKRTSTLETDPNVIQQLLTDLEQKLMYEIYKYPWITYEELAPQFFCSRTKIAQLVGSLRKRGFLWRQGNNRQGAWVMAPLIRDYLKKSFSSV